MRSFLLFCTRVALTLFFYLYAHCGLAAEPPESADNLQSEILDNIATGGVVPSLYYSHSHSVTLALAYIFNDEEDTEQAGYEPYVQLEASSRAVLTRAGIFAYSSVGASYALSASLLQMTADENDELFHREGSYAGAELSIMFGLAVARLGYYRALDEDRRVSDPALNLSIGIGLF